MKHILAVLTVALAGAATTASAATFYDFYNSVSVSATNSYQPEGTGWRPTYNTDTVTYDDFQIIRTSPQNTPLGTSAHYKLAITGDKVDIYLTDFVDDTGNPFNKNSLANIGVTQYGYRYLDENGLPLTEKPESIDVPTTPDVIDSVTFNEGTPQEYTVTRNKYKLGTFSKGDVIELYMASGDNEAFSYSNINNASDAAQGGYGDGTKFVENTDKLMLYYKEGNVTAANKAMPLAGLDLIDVPNSTRGRVYFGVYGQAAETFGAPLPGGTAIYVIAGLFALGFIVVRRRKEIAA